jgi:hypothetical protein
VILNGPAKFWRKELMPKERMHAFFCDSIADLERTVAAMRGGRDVVQACRRAHPHAERRVALRHPARQPGDVPQAGRGVKRLPADSAFGVHFHMASSNIGVAGQWWHLFESMLKWCQSIEKLTGRTIEILDMGGGWFPDDWHDDEQRPFAKAVETVREALPNVKQIVSEPGKAMAQPSMALAMRILEIQEHEDDYGRGGGRRVDRRAADVLLLAAPDAAPVQRDRRAAAVGRGKTHLMGRLCMEHDIVAPTSTSGRDPRRRPSDLLRCRRLRQEHVLCIWPRLRLRAPTLQVEDRPSGSAAPLASARWQHFPDQHLSHHGEACCDVAREWIVAMDFAQLNGGDRLSGPRWLRQKYEWGPSPWPMHWCELVERKVIDCGAHAALAHEAFTARGVTAFRAQFVQRYSADAQASGAANGAPSRSPTTGSATTSSTTRAMRSWSARTR